jgi:hypothetical protein
MTVNIEKARIMLWSAGGLLATSVSVTAVLVWNVSQFVSSERDAQAIRMVALRDEVAEIGDAVAVQAVEMKWIRDILGEVRADVRALNGAKRDAGDK